MSMKLPTSIQLGVLGCKNVMLMTAVSASKPPTKVSQSLTSLVGRNVASGGGLVDNEEVARPWWSGCCLITGVVLGGWMHF